MFCISSANARDIIADMKIYLEHVLHLLHTRNFDENNEFLPNLE